MSDPEVAGFGLLGYADALKSTRHIYEHLLFQKEFELESEAQAYFELQKELLRHLEAKFSIYMRQGPELAKHHSFDTDKDTFFVRARYTISLKGSE